MYYDKEAIQVFLNFVCFETQGLGGTSSELEELLEEFFTEEGEGL